MIQSRAPRITDTFTAKDIVEVAELDPSAREALIEKVYRYPQRFPTELFDNRPTVPARQATPLVPSRPSVLKVAIVKEGTVQFQDTESFQEFVH